MPAIAFPAGRQTNNFSIYLEAYKEQQLKVEPLFMDKVFSEHKSAIFEDQHH